jgi:hypothetical protein
MANEKSPKIPNMFCCNYCDYYTSSKKDYTKHLLTLKHKRLIAANENAVKNPKNPEKSLHHICGCGNIYKHPSSLCKHKKKCNKNIYEIIEKPIINVNDMTDKEIIMLLIEQHSKVVEQNNGLLEVIKNGTHNTNNSHNNMNSNNKTFNLQFFLNETCKDAMNIMDFVDSIQLQLSDLENVGKIGYVEGISNIINKNLQALDVTLRPVHCTDKKREVLYIKDENKWEKECESKTKIRKVIKHVAHKNSKLLTVFREKYPDCGKSISKYSDKFNKIVIEAMGGPGDNDTEKEDKIIANISKNVAIDKENEYNHMPNSLV